MSSCFQCFRLFHVLIKTAITILLTPTPLSPSQRWHRLTTMCFFHMVVVRGCRVYCSLALAICFCFCCVFLMKMIDLCDCEGLCCCCCFLMCFVVVWCCVFVWVLLWLFLVRRWLCLLNCFPLLSSCHVQLVPLHLWYVWLLVVECLQWLMSCLCFGG